MADIYGRSKATYAQKGTSLPYGTFAPTTAENKLTGQEYASYTQALNTLAGDVKLKKSGKIKHRKRVVSEHQAALNKISKLRNLAAERAFKDYSAAAMKTSKPWLVKAPSEGLIATAAAPHSLAHSSYLGGEGVPRAPYLTRTERKKALKGERQFGAIDINRARNLYREFRAQQPIDFG